MMEVKKTVLFTFCKAPKTCKQCSDKQETFSKKEETLILYQHQKSCLCVASSCTFYGDFLKTGDLGCI